VRNEARSVEYFVRVPSDDTEIDAMLEIHKCSNCDLIVFRLKYHKV
jgi:hypothetical protein